MYWKFQSEPVTNLYINVLFCFWYKQVIEYKRVPTTIRSGHSCLFLWETESFQNRNSKRKYLLAIISRFATSKPKTICLVNTMNTI